MRNAPSLSFRSRATVVCAALGVASALAGAGAMVAPTVAAAADTCPVSQMSTASQPSCWQPFTDGPFNTELSSTPALASNSAAVVSHMTANNWSIGYPGSGYMLGPGSRPCSLPSRQTRR